MLNEAEASLASVANCAAEASANKRASEPAHGRSLGGLVERCGAPIRESVSLLQSRLSQVSTYEAEHLFSYPTSEKHGAHQESLQERIAWYVINICILHCISLKSANIASVRDATEWFFESSEIQPSTILSLFDQETLELVHGILQGVKVSSYFIDLLPYIVEPHGHVTRGRLERDEAAGKTRAKKRLSGVFYTPSDVAEFMVTALANDKGDGTWLDPACGTGVFLREVLRLHIKKHPRNATEYCEKHLYGLDISTLATESCGFVLLADCLWLGGVELQSPYQAWRKVVQNIVPCDSLAVEGSNPVKVSEVGQIDLFNEGKPLLLSDIFPGVSDGFTHIVMNPPYSRLSITQRYQAVWGSYSAQKVGSSGFAALPFAEMLSRFKSKGGNAAAVLPLSVGTSTVSQFKKCRQVIARSGGLWEFLFFDREPHALFGEDIKTRNAIIFHEDLDSESTTIRTSGLLRWTSRTRQKIFNRDRAVTLNSSDISSFVPKLGSSSELVGYAQLQSLCSGEVWARPAVERSPLSACIEPCREGTLYIGSTAYNFINVFFGFSVTSDETARLSQSPVHSMRFPSKKVALACFAVLVSRMTFWLWHVEGDGFHVTAEFLKRLPVWHLQLDEKDIDSLAILGDEIWTVAMSNKAPAVNGGKLTYSFYCPFNHPAALAVEKILLAAAGLIPTFSVVLDDFIHATISNKLQDKRLGLFDFS